jgi:hypothetical protein
MIVETKAMMSKISAKERRLAANYAWGPSTAIWAYLISKGATTVTPEQFNPFIDTPELSNNKAGNAASKSGRKLSWMSKETAKGILMAVEKKLLPSDFWVKASGIYFDIVSTAQD